MDTHPTIKADTVDVVFCSDEKYLPHCASAIVSLLENEPKVDRVFLIASGIPNTTIDKFTGHIAKNFGKHIEVLEASHERLRNVFTSGHINASTYLRFLIADLLPEDVYFVLYLDSDLIVTAPFVELLPPVFLDRVDRDSLYMEPVLWAVPEGAGGHLRDKGFDVPQYFNAGVIYMNLRRWRQEGIGQRLFEAEERYRQHISFWDQDVMNIMLVGRWQALNPSLNGLSQDRTKRTCIVHFNSNLKPWQVGARPFEANLYEKYRRKTNFLPYRKEWSAVSFLRAKLPAPLFLRLKAIKNRVSSALAE